MPKAQRKLSTLPLQLECVSCGDKMRLSRIEPHHDAANKTDLATFECKCGYSIKQTATRLPRAS